MIIIAMSIAWIAIAIFYFVVMANILGTCILDLRFMQSMNWNGGLLLIVKSNIKSAIVRLVITLSNIAIGVQAIFLLRHLVERLKPIEGASIIIIGIQMLVSEITLAWLSISDREVRQKVATIHRRKLPSMEKDGQKERSSKAYRTAGKE